MSPRRAIDLGDRRGYPRAIVKPSTPRKPGRATAIATLLATLALSVAAPAVGDEPASADADAGASAPAQPTPRNAGALAHDAIGAIRREADSAGVRLEPKPKADRPDSYRLVMLAAPFSLAFYGDGGPLYAPLPGSTGFHYGSAALAFPDAYHVHFDRSGKLKPVTTRTPAEYFERLLALGDKASALSLDQSRAAEVVLYTLDSNDDGAVDASDRGADGLYTLRRVAYGAKLDGDKASETTTARDAATGVFVHALPDDKAKPLPLFVYQLSERFADFDLDGDGDKNDELVFGDANGDGRLDDAEAKAVLATATDPRPGLCDHLDADPRFAAKDGKPSLLERLAKQYPKLSGAQIRQVVQNAVVAAKVEFSVEFDDAARHARVRKRFLASVGFRNALIRLRGMTR